MDNVEYKGCEFISADTHVVSFLAKYQLNRSVDAEFLRYLATHTYFEPEYEHVERVDDGFMVSVMCTCEVDERIEDLPFDESMNRIVDDNEKDRLSEHLTESWAAFFCDVCHGYP